MVAKDLGNAFAGIVRERKVTCLFFPSHHLLALVIWDLFSIALRATHTYFLHPINIKMSTTSIIWKGNRERLKNREVRSSLAWAQQVPR